ncbi:hypothetical protein FBU59_002479 [Linderina macrospora]|uniref:Uncharacterized protein n=1 Tax=Linderina macrospora TaxID=4868 RepID=A0ACC1JB19_9FUNG|nr:hypothetical protein FBU59_002479 [Linderina macrospora]
MSFGPVKLEKADSFEHDEPVVAPVSAVPKLEEIPADVCKDKLAELESLDVPGSIVPRLEDSDDLFSDTSSVADESISRLVEVPGFKVELFDYQMRAVREMTDLEYSVFMGGILTGDCGVGKRVEILALVKERLKSRQSGLLGTLIITSVAGREQWTNLINNFLKPGQLKCADSHGPDRHRLNLYASDIVITTPQTLYSDYKRYYETSPIFQGRWDRVVVDHHLPIKKGTKSAVACLALVAKYHWFVSSNPLRHGWKSYMDVHAFLEIDPPIETEAEAEGLDRSGVLPRCYDMREIMVQHRKEDRISQVRVEERIVDVNLSEYEWDGYMGLNDVVDTYELMSMSKPPAGMPPKGKISVKLQTKNMESIERRYLGNPSLAMTPAVAKNLKLFGTVFHTASPFSIPDLVGNVKKYQPTGRDMKGSQPSTKVSTIVKILESLRTKDAPLKAVLCVEHVGMEKILADHAERAGFKPFILSNKQSLAASRKTLEQYRGAKTDSVAIGMTEHLQYGSDLSCASAIVFEAPSSECGRVHGCIGRLLGAGQKNDSVSVYDVIVYGSIDADTRHEFVKSREAFYKIQTGTDNPKDQVKPNRANHIDPELAFAGAPLKDLPFAYYV